ncbi:MAG: hypothetical protein R6X22_12480 [Gemmatimonadota bacterium]
MITETVSALSPERVIEEAKRFFTGGQAVLPAQIVDESDRHLTVSTFRSRVAVSAFPDPEGAGTRVRVSTLRRNDAVGKLVALLATASDAAPAAGEG